MLVTSTSVGWRFLRWCMCALGFFVGEFGVRAESSNLRLSLVADAGGETWRDFSVENGAIVASAHEGGGLAPLPANVKWRLEGNLKLNAGRFRYFPTYQIDESPPDRASPVSRAFATVMSTEWSWSDYHVPDAIVVCVWLVDGKPELVLPVVATPTEARFYAAVQAVELDARTKGGVPVLLLFSRGRFLSARPLFPDQAAQRVVEMMHFGSGDDLREAIARLKSADARDGSGATLLHIAADLGMHTAAELLLKAGIKADVQTSKHFRPADWAAEDGRRDIVKLLVSPDSGSRSKIDGNLVNYAKMHNHLEVVADLAALAPKLAEYDCAALAVANGRADLIEDLIARGGRAAVERLSAKDLVAPILLGNDRLLDLLMSEGMKAGLKGSGGAPLVAAAEAENEHALAVLLQAGAKASSASGNGTTALMIASSHGWTAGAKLLLAAGADPRAKGPAGVTALHYAAATGRADIAALLLERGAERDWRDGNGCSALELALRVRSEAATTALVAAGARLDLAQKTFPDAVVHALALDQVELVERAVADGWPAGKTFFQGFNAVDLAGGFEAKRIQAYFRRLSPGEPSGGLVVEKAPDIPPKLQKGSRPPDLRSWDHPQPAISGTIAGLVDESGRFMLPKLEGCEDAVIARVILNAVPTWQFTPAQKNGRPVKAAMSLAVNYPAHDNRVYTSSEVDMLPVARTRIKLEPSVFEINNYAVSEDIEVIYQIDSSGHPIPELVPVTRLTNEPEFEKRRGDYAVIAFVVEPNGRTSHPVQLGGSKPVFESQALAALQRSRFSPGTCAGIPVRTRMTLVFQPDLE